MRSFIYIAALLIAAIFGTAYAQEHNLADISEEGSRSVPAKPSGYYGKQSRKFSDIWNELHPPGKQEKKRKIAPVPQREKKVQGGIGQIGASIKKQPETAPQETNSGGSAAPDVPTESIGGIGAVGSPNTPAADEENNADDVAPGTAAEPQEPADGAASSTDNAIGSVGGLGAVGAPEKK